MHFIKISDSIADKLYAQWNGHSYDDQNPADKGELCEHFVKEFIEGALGDTYRVIRGGNIITSGGGMSKQLDVIVCSRHAIQFFPSKGKYPVEIVKGVFSITSTLTLSKLDECLEGLASIPKTGYHFHFPAGVYPDKFIEDTQRIFEDITPVSVVFAYQGDIKPTWIDHLNDWINNNKPHHSLMPTFIVVNKKGMIYKQVLRPSEKKLSISYKYIDFTYTGHPGDAFCRILNELFNLAKEDHYLTPDYSYYLNADLESIARELQDRNK